MGCADFNFFDSGLSGLGIDEYKLLKAWAAENGQTSQVTRLKYLPLGKIN
jgi:hypothetical protein